MREVDGVAKKMTRSVAEKRLAECHSKFLKIFSNQGMNQWITPTDLDAMLKIINRVNARMLKRR